MIRTTVPTLGMMLTEQVKLTFEVYVLSSMKEITTCQFQRESKLHYLLLIWIQYRKHHSTTRQG